MADLFGTDGVRGVANTELSAFLGLKLGAASAYVLRKKHEGAKILIGRDPRISGDIIESAMAAGICSLGVDVYLVGVVPTPAVAFLSRQIQADAGVVISASHNQMQDNGLKFFGGDGYKLNDGIESEIEDHVDNFEDLPYPVGAGVGRMFRAEELVESYLEHLKAGFPVNLNGIKIILDCANGAVSHLAPRLFADLGAEVTAVNSEPDGLNINLNAGSLHPQTLRNLVMEEKAHLGLAFDGDGDRAILVDEKGNLIHGDHLLAICALHMASTGRLNPRIVVSTVMSNIGLEMLLARENIQFIRTQVGDRYVSDEMRRTDAVLGGEQSGHVILKEHSTTGDGMVTGLEVLSVMLQSGRPLSELAAQLQTLPQLLVNVRVKSLNGWREIPEIAQAVEEGEERLAGRGRVFVRASGTEKLIRVMAEGPDMKELEDITEQIASQVRRALGG